MVTLHIGVDDLKFEFDIIVRTTLSTGEVEWC